MCISVCGYILNIIIWQQSNSAIFNILYRIMKNSLYSHRKYSILYKRKWQPYNLSVQLDLKVTLKDTRLILNIIYVWKLNQTVGFTLMYWYHLWLLCLRHQVQLLLFFYPFTYEGFVEVLMYEMYNVMHSEVVLMYNNESYLGTLGSSYFTFYQFKL